MPLLKVTILPGAIAMPLAVGQSPFGSSSGTERTRMRIEDEPDLVWTRYRVAIETEKPSFEHRYIKTKVAAMDSLGQLAERVVWINKNSLKKRFSTLHGLPILQRLYPKAAREAINKDKHLSLSISETSDSANTVDKVRRTLRKLPRSDGYAPLDDAEIGRLQEALIRARPVTDPKATVLKTDRFARTILQAPKSDTYEVFNDPISGDKILGKGAFKTAYYAVGSDGGLYAVSICDVDQLVRNCESDCKCSQDAMQQYREDIITELRREAAFASEIPENAKGLLRTRLTVEDQGRFYFVMKLCEGGDLESLVAKLQKSQMIMTIKERLTIASEALEGLDSLHHLGILHRDLKLGNILLQARYSSAALSDFGLIAHKKGEESGGGKRVGTPYYMAPEVVKKETPTEQSDVWALGVSLYQLVTLQNMPWKGKGNQEIYDYIGSLPEGWAPRFPEEPLLSDPSLDRELKALISEMLSIDPAKRPTAQNAQQRISKILTQIEEPLVY